MGLLHLSRSFLVRFHTFFAMTQLDGLPNISAHILVVIDLPLGFQFSNEIPHLIDFPCFFSLLREFDEGPATMKNSIRPVEGTMIFAAMMKSFCECDHCPSIRNIHTHIRRRASREFNVFLFRSLSLNRFIDHSSFLLPFFGKCRSFSFPDRTVFTLRIEMSVIIAPATIVRCPS